MDKQYEEPEGIFPDGKHTLVECDRHASLGKEFKGLQYIDIHKLTLDGSGKYERITHFNDYPGWKATNLKFLARKTNNPLYYNTLSRI